MKKLFLQTILTTALILVLGLFSAANSPVSAQAPSCYRVAEAGCNCDRGRSLISIGGETLCLPDCANNQDLVEPRTCACNPDYAKVSGGRCIFDDPARPAPGGAGGATGINGITNPVTGNLGNNPVEAKQGTTFTNFLITLWRAIISVGGLMVLIYFLWGGIEWITAGGDTAKVQKARDRITQSIIGLVILVASFVIIGFISELFFGSDFNLLEITIPTPI